MKTNDIFRFTTPNGAIAKAVCIYVAGTIGNYTEYLCYSQNRIFTLEEYSNMWVEDSGELCKESNLSYGHEVVPYAILPDYDICLNDESTAPYLITTDSY